MWFVGNVAKKGNTGPDGTTVSVTDIKELVVKAALQVSSKPTCLHDVRDPTKSNAVRTPLLFQNVIA
jgi:hypothetical protein